jgi:hypothetical protein
MHVPRNTRGTGRKRSGFSQVRHLPLERSGTAQAAERQRQPRPAAGQIQPWYHIRAYQELYGMTFAASTG